jgi:hypothetical protein
LITLLNYVTTDESELNRVYAILNQNIKNNLELIKQNPDVKLEDENHFSLGFTSNIINFATNQDAFHVKKCLETLIVYIKGLYSLKNCNVVFWRALKEGKRVKITLEGVGDDI